MSTSRATLSAASDDRKARLAKLKTLKRKQPGDEIVAPESERAGSLPAVAAEEEGADDEQPNTTTTTITTTTEDAVEEVDVARLHLSGRNYDAEAKGPKLGFEAPPTLGVEDRTLEAQAADVEAAVRKAKAERDATDATGAGVDLFTLQPRKPNWDLRRDLDRKLEVLNVRTDNAIARLVRERINGAQEKSAAKTGGGSGDSRDGEAAGMDGVSLVEGARVRQRIEEEEERRERQEVEEGVLL